MSSSSSLFTKLKLNSQKQSSQSHNDAELESFEKELQELWIHLQSIYNEYKVFCDKMCNANNSLALLNKTRDSFYSMHQGNDHMDNARSSFSQNIAIRSIESFSTNQKNENEILKILSEWMLCIQALIDKIKIAQTTFAEIHGQNEKLQRALTKQSSESDKHNLFQSKRTEQKLSNKINESLGNLIVLNDKFNRLKSEISATYKQMMDRKLERMDAVLLLIFETQRSVYERCLDEIKQNGIKFEQKEPQNQINYENLINIDDEKECSEPFRHLPSLNINDILSEYNYGEYDENESEYDSLINLTSYSFAKSSEPKSMQIFNENNGKILYFMMMKIKLNFNDKYLEKSGYTDPILFDLNICLKSKYLHLFEINAVYSKLLNLSDEMNKRENEIINIPELTAYQLLDINNQIILIQFTSECDLFTNDICIETSYRDKYNERYEDVQYIKSGEEMHESSVYFENKDIRKAILLTNFVEFMRKWTQNEGQQSLFDEFVEYYRREMEIIGDKTLAKCLHLVSSE